MADLSPTNAIEAGADVALAARTIRQIVWRFMPLLMACYLTAYVDRVNVGFAALTANQDIGLSPSQYGWGAGLFFIGYSIAELPSNLILLRVGARLWFARIMVSMGIGACATAWVIGPWSFYAARLALGVAEAGLLPGVIWFFRAWVPRVYRAQYMAIFLLCIPLSSFIGSPVSGAILGMNGWMGLKGWQWLFILEGAPCILFGIMVLFFLTETPESAAWLTPEQRRWLRHCYAEERDSRAAGIEGERVRTWSLMIDGRTLCYGAAFAGVLTGSYGLSLWLPQIIKEFGTTNFQTGLITAIPFGFGCVATVVMARHSDRTGERVWHVVLPSFVSTIGLGASALIGSPTLMIAAVSLAAVGIFGIRGSIFALISERFSDGNAAAGIALIGAYSSLGSFASLYAVGVLKEATGTFIAGMLLLAGLSFLGGIIILARTLYERRVLGLRVR